MKKFLMSLMLVSLFSIFTVQVSFGQEYPRIPERDKIGPGDTYPTEPTHLLEELNNTVCNPGAVIGNISGNETEGFSCECPPEFPHNTSISGSGDDATCCCSPNPATP